MQIETTKKIKRYNSLDFIRGFAVILMIIFHFFYDLDLFGHVDINFLKDPFWYWLPRFIVFLFMLSMGMSMCLAHRKSVKMRPYLKRLIKIGVCAIGISLTTYFLFPKNWVYFGTLHCIFFSTIIVTPFIKMPLISIGFFYFFMILEVLGMTPPFFAMDHAAMDYIPIYPWVGFSFLGIYLVHFDFLKFQMKSNTLTQPILFLGKHALIIYLVHQPIMYGLVWLYSKNY